MTAKKNKREGGLITVYGGNTTKEKPAKQLAESKTNKYDREIKTVKKYLSKYDERDNYNEKRLVEALRRLDKYIKTNKEFNSLNDFVQQYCKWLDGGYGMQIEYYSTKLFDPENKIFKSFQIYVEQEYEPKPQDDSWMGGSGYYCPEDHFEPKFWQTD